ncbi:MAG: hypothetical protein WAV60_11370 [Anaerolineae bacterium]
MSNKTIGPAGARLLTTLAERDRPIFSVAEAQAVIGGDYGAVVQTLRRLGCAFDGWPLCHDAALLSLMLDGKLTQTIEAVQSIPVFVRKFSWDQ